MATESLILGPANDGRPDFFEKFIAILLCQSSLELKNFMKLKKTQMFHLVIKLKKPFVVPKTCTRCKTKRTIGIILFGADNYNGVIENFQ